MNSDIVYNYKVNIYYILYITMYYNSSVHTYIGDVLVCVCVCVCVCVS